MLKYFHLHRVLVFLLHAQSINFSDHLLLLQFIVLLFLVDFGKFSSGICLRLDTRLSLSLLSCKNLLLLDFLSLLLLLGSALICLSLLFFSKLFHNVVLSQFEFNSGCLLTSFLNLGANELLPNGSYFCFVSHDLKFTRFFLHFNLFIFTFGAILGDYLRFF